MNMIKKGESVPPEKSLMIMETKPPTAYKCHKETKPEESKKLTP
jgi:hypothetical protein